MRLIITDKVILFGLILLLSRCAEDPSSSHRVKIDIEKTFESNVGSFGSLQSLSKVDNNHLILAGWSSSSKNGAIPDDDVYIVKLNDALDSIWSKSFGGTKDDLVRCIVGTNDGGYLFCATTSSNDGHIENNQGDADIWLLKLDQTGEIQWSKTYGGSNYDGVNSNSIFLNANGNYTIVGFTKSVDGDVNTHIGGDDIWVLEIDSQGEIIAQLTFGSAGNDYPFAITRSDENGYVILSKIGSSDATFDKPGIWVFNAGTDGNIIWKEHFDGLNAGIIRNTKDGGYIILNSVSQNTGDLAVYKIDNFGKTEWSKNFPFDNQEFPEDIIELDNGNFILLGTSDNQQFIGKILVIGIDTKGNKLYDEFYGSADVTGQSIVEMNDGKIVIGGTKSVHTTFIKSSILVLGLSSH
ncbi:MAG TPA: hypothetical protein DHV26_16805 [Cytophagales bacterium]|nr:hypothetical protein [Cytophagales bacterium]HRG07095.1 hypothetical protein [Cyclobacteriaceae bacterium]